MDQLLLLILLFEVKKFDLIKYLNLIIMIMAKFVTTILSIVINLIKESFFNYLRP